MATQTPNGPTGLLGQAVETMLSAVGKRVVSSASDRMGAATERLVNNAANGGGGMLSALTGGATDKVKSGLGKAKEFLGGGGGDGNLKVTNIVESIDIGVPVSVAYNQWTQFTDFPSFMKKVEHVEQEEPEKLTWKAQVFWSHRTWESEIIDRVPDQRIVWRSQGEKGYPDGAVTFHELGPNLTRIIMILEYHPQGFFEHTGNLWRAPARRARLELKHFARHVMTDTILHPQEVSGWRGEIHDGEVTAEPDDEQPEGASDPKRPAEKTADSRARPRAERDSRSPDPAPQDRSRGERSGRTARPKVSS
jgi:uncharacterized membrane protein